MDKIVDLTYTTRSRTKSAGLVLASAAAGPGDILDKRLLKEQRLMDSAGGPARIVVVEDNPADVTLLRYALDHHQEPYELEVLRDGEEALHFVHQFRTGARQPHPCVFVLDLYLPRYDGLAVLRAIREEPVLAHIHVIVLTTQPTPAEEQELLELGTRLCRSKPMNLEDLKVLGGEILEICKEYSASA
jgi:two-component system, chemotaxis family, response regulator Rcp1